MTQLPTCHAIARKGHAADATLTVTLSYEDRFLRRKVLTARDELALTVRIRSARF